MKNKSWIKDALGGVALGTGILPGVSVGTVGMIVNVYDKLLESISGLGKQFKKSVLMLLPIAVGCLISAFGLLLFWKKVAYPYFPFPIICALAGVVLGSLPICAGPLKGIKFDWKDILRMVGGFLIASSIGIFSFLSASGVISLQFDVAGAFKDPFHNIWVYAITLIVGFIAAVACLIPGISGSMVLFIFGLYTPVVGLLISTRDAEGKVIDPSIFHDMGNKAYFWGGALLILALLIGMLIGFILASKAMKSLIEKHSQGTFTMVIGFVLGSLVSMFVNNDTYAIYTNPNLSVPWQYIVGGILFVSCACGMFFLIKFRQKQAAQPNEENPQ